MCVSVLAEGTDLCEEELVPRMAALLLKLQGSLPPQVRRATSAELHGRPLPSGRVESEECSRDHDRADRSHSPLDEG